MGGGDPLFLWLIVLAADGLFAALPGLRAVLAAPLALIDRLIGWFDARLNREKRSSASRTLRGALVVLVLALAAWVAGVVLAGLARGLPGGWLIEAVVLVCLIYQRRLIAQARQVAESLAAGDLSAARNALAPMAGFETGTEDEFAIARGTVEAAATRFNDGVVAAAFWYFLLGLPGLCAWRTINVAAARIGRATPRLAAFGQFAARLNDVLGFVPGIISGAVLSLASVFVPSASPARAFAGWFGALHPRHVLGNRVCRGPMAGALGLTLSAPRPRLDGTADEGWVGDGRARVTTRDVGRALFLLVVACLIAAALIAGLVMARVLA